jgi:hypothetical protein
LGDMMRAPQLGNGVTGEEFTRNHPLDLFLENGVGEEPELKFTPGSKRRRTTVGRPQTNRTPGACQLPSSLSPSDVRAPVQLGVPVCTAQQGATLFFCVLLRNWQHDILNERLGAVAPSQEKLSF